ncbi:hypothetical protein ACT54M_09820 [Leptospira santarosai]|uniref:Uncharacterized protein n=1 Tax=Leptospira santarosai serovar Arenal str. MAVJ 401 TaxID=1049976 RepID=M6JUE1_9LEPT|nr:hypothetical protein [Leptospira santarosai]EMF90423.1 hypothetical protein LEP1GSC005_0499 [Leptospira santarosai str. ST188]EMJ51193.1 hypothetical protein LEP1GSC169_0481 [Leptospira santarosai str. HAI1349]EMM77074.1 hypothetical protein LEP1GSC040_0124 [Leptospira santarosai str. 2000030832]EMN23235.1 hypothetical protein LEP1GSC063_0545 [Leptospira santarosai serovar Arenal str. MAVJ 401]EMO14739.1 hypothetical protein LEP1GSC165_2850 [Leptospira santarosai str. CBC523]EMO23125.1 hyp
MRRDYGYIGWIVLFAAKRKSEIVRTEQIYGVINPEMIESTQRY